MSDRTERIRVSTVGYIGQGQRRRGLHGNPLWIAIKRQFSGLLIKVSVAHKSKAAVKDQFIIYWRTTAKWFGTHHSEWGRRFAMMLKGRRRWLFVSLKLLSSCVMGMKINIRILKLGIAGHNKLQAGEVEQNSRKMWGELFEAHSNLLFITNFSSPRKVIIAQLGEFAISFLRPPFQEHETFNLWISEISEVIMEWLVTMRFFYC